jgi:hypothetical protein
MRKKPTQKVREVRGEERLNDLLHGDDPITYLDARHDWVLRLSAKQRRAVIDRTMIEARAFVDKCRQILNEQSRLQKRRVH